MKSIAIIPARGGSKRLPRKNILNFGNIPIIAHTIKAAIKSRAFNKIVVSTEDQKIKAISLKFGAEIHDRPKKLAKDNTKVAEVLLATIKHYESKKIYYDAVCCLLPTSPLRDSKDINSVMSLLSDSNTDYAMAVTKFPYPAWQALKETTNKNVFKPLWPKIIDKSSQEIGELYVDNGSTYGIKVSSLKKYKSLNGKIIKGHKMNYYKSIDIDYKEDFELANLFYKYLKK